MTVGRITSAKVAQAVEEAIPRIATQLRPDVLTALAKAQADEDTPRAQAVLAQLLENAAIAQRDAVPLCQDTGTVWVYLEVGEEEILPANVFSEVDAAVGRAYRTAHLRMSLLHDALVNRTNTQDNTPAFCEVGFRAGHGATLHIMLKGGGSDNASRVCMLTPSAGEEGVIAAVVECVREKASNACPPLVLGIGIGSTFDHVAGLAKKALLREVGSVHSDAKIASFEQKLLNAVNATGIGPGALGGNTTALAVHVCTAPCHIAALPLAINLGCSALRSTSIEL